MLRTTPPTSQLVGIRPISFVLDDNGSIGKPVMLAIRPEELTRNEPARVTVHQTLGRAVSGWADDFGEGLPSLTISGNTGWRYKDGTQEDGSQAFHSLNDLIVHKYPAAKQSAINGGRDPSDVKLLFIDMLDDFSWSVSPTQFQLRRSKSRPLLFQYQISMQALDTSIDSPALALPFFGSVPAGLSALDSAINELGGMVSSIDGFVKRALGFVDGALSPITSTIKSFVKLSNAVFSVANAAIRGANNLVSGVSSKLIGMASDLAGVGASLFRTLNGIANLPADVKASLSKVSSAFNSVACIFANSLSRGSTYEDYTGLYGASNCSSTTGGRAASAYANGNPFALIQPEKNVATMNTAAQASLSTLARMDSVLAPMPIPEVGRHLTNIVNGTAL